MVIKELRKKYLYRGGGCVMRDAWRGDACKTYRRRDNHGPCHPATRPPVTSKTFFSFLNRLARIWELS